MSGLDYERTVLAAGAAGHHAGLPGRDPAVRPRAQAVRQSHRVVPADAGQDRRHVRRPELGPAPTVYAVAKACDAGMTTRFDAAAGRDPDGQRERGEGQPGGHPGAGAARATPRTIRSSACCATPSCMTSAPAPTRSGASSSDGSWLADEEAGLPHRHQLGGLRGQRRAETAPSWTNCGPRRARRPSAARRRAASVTPAAASCCRVIG